MEGNFDSVCIPHLEPNSELEMCPDISIKDQPCDGAPAGVVNFADIPKWCAPDEVTRHQAHPETDLYMSPLPLQITAPSPALTFAHSRGPRPTTTNTTTKMRVNAPDLVRRVSCLFCNVKLVNYKKLLVHVKKRHGKFRNFLQCEQCNEVFLSSLLFRDHKKAANCSESVIINDVPRDSETATDESPDNRLESGLAGSQSRSSNTFKKPILPNSTSLLNLNADPFHFVEYAINVEEESSDLKYEYHKRFEQKVKTFDSERIPCISCTKSFASYENLHKHARSFHAIIKYCLNCKAIFESELLLKEHTEAASCSVRLFRERLAPTTCKKCGLVIDPYIPVKNHVCSMATIHNSATDDASSDVCSMATTHNSVTDDATSDVREAIPPNVISTSHLNINSFDYLDYPIDIKEESLDSSIDPLEEQEYDNCKQLKSAASISYVYVPKFSLPAVSTRTKSIKVSHKVESIGNLASDSELSKQCDATIDVNGPCDQSTDPSHTSTESIYPPRILELMKQLNTAGGPLDDDDTTISNCRSINKCFHCNECNEDLSFDAYFGLHLHICVLHTSIVVCSLCEVRFTYSSNVNEFAVNKLEHLLNCHVKKARWLACKFCSRKFPLRTNTKRHFKNKHFTLVEKIDKIQEKQDTTLTPAAETISLNQNKCMIKLYDYKKILQYYLNKLSLKTIKMCKIKNIIKWDTHNIFKNKAYVDNELHRMYFEVPNITSQNLYLCEKTNTSDVCQNIMKDSVTPEEFCDEICVYCISCNHVIPIVTYIVSHASLCASSHSNYICPFCAPSVDSTTTDCILTHINSHLEHMSQQHSALQIKCQVCQFTFLTEVNKELHHNLMHSNTSAFQCKSCELTLPSEQAIQGHIRDYHIPINFQGLQSQQQQQQQLKSPSRLNSSATFDCDSCGVRRITKYGLQLHIQQTHFPPNGVQPPVVSSTEVPQTKEKKIYRCSLCEVSHDTERDLVSHVESTHAPPSSSVTAALKRNKRKPELVVKKDDFMEILFES